MKTYRIYTSKGILETDSEANFRLICSMFMQVNAGGGLVRNRDGKYLMIFRKGFWDLPKGKQEEGETIEECALREVGEETGLNGLKLGGLICETHHTFNIYGPPTIKHTRWFEMEYEGDGMPEPEADEGITEVAWLTKEEALDRAAGSFASIREVILTHIGHDDVVTE